MSYFNREFKVLSREQLERVHALTLDILRVKGVLFHSEVAREILAAHGAKVDGACVTFPASLVERCLSQCPAGFVWRARDPQKHLYGRRADGCIRHAGSWPGLCAGAPR